jgi:hypothetical protein
VERSRGEAFPSRRPMAPANPMAAPGVAARVAGRAKNPSRADWTWLKPGPEAVGRCRPSPSPPASGGSRTWRVASSPAGGMLRRRAREQGDHDGSPPTVVFSEVHSLRLRFRENTFYRFPRGAPGMPLTASQAVVDHLPRDAARRSAHGCRHRLQPKAIGLHGAPLRAPRRVRAAPPARRGGAVPIRGPSASTCRSCARRGRPDPPTRTSALPLRQMQSLLGATEPKSRRYYGPACGGSHRRHLPRLP